MIKIFLAIGFFVVIAAVGYFVSTNGSQKSIVSTNLSNNQVPDNSQGEISQPQENSEGEGSSYMQYSKPVLESSSNTRRVLFFYASWCPTCRPADESFTQNENRIPERTAVIRVNYNDPDTDSEEKELAVKYGVTYQHTFVQIDSQGNLVTKWNGGAIDELISNIK